MRFNKIKTTDKIKNKGEFQLQEKCDEQTDGLTDEDNHNFKSAGMIRKKIKTTLSA